MRAILIFLIFPLIFSCKSNPDVLVKHFKVPQQLISYLKDTSENMILNKNYSLRDSILNFHCNWDTVKGGILYYKDLTIQQLTDLLLNKFINPNEYQNESPTVRVFYQFMAKYPFTMAHGYTVSPKRDDYRISIEGLYIPKMYLTDSLKRDFKVLCKDADEYSDQDDLYSWWD